uniref:Uncharacterized protein n=1 Tax=Rhizophora mucronata TaxID=61149 RepID=A0A2P2IPP3_RHIMU
MPSTFMHNGSHVKLLTASFKKC